MKKHSINCLLFILTVLLPEMVTAQWNMVRFDTHNYFTKAYTVTPNNAVVTGLDAGTGSFLLRSNNGGLSWDSIALNLTGNYQLHDLFFTDINNGYAGGLKNANEALIKTSDNGSTWSEITPDPLSSNPITSISFIDPQNGFVAGQSSIYKTIDGGVNWTSVSPGFAISDISFLDMINGYACGEANTNAIVMKTNDGGQTWSNLLTVTSPLVFVNNMEKLVVVNQNIIFSSFQYLNTLYRTINGGLSWDTITLPLIYAIQDYDFVDANIGHVLSSMGEIFGTIDGGLTWNLEYAVASGAYGPSVFLNSISFSGTTGYVCGSNGLIKKYSVSTGIDDHNLAESVSLYPNPVSASNILYINGITGSCTIEILNKFGQMVLKQNGKTEENQVMLNKIKLQAGVYTINIYNNKTRYTGKLVIVD